MSSDNFHRELLGNFLASTDAMRTEAERILADEGSLKDFNDAAERTYNNWEAIWEQYHEMDLDDIGKRKKLAHNAYETALQYIANAEAMISKSKKYEEAKMPWNEEFLEGQK